MRAERARSASHMHHGGARKAWLQLAMNYFHGVVVVPLWHRGDTRDILMLLDASRSQTLHLNLSSGLCVLLKRCESHHLRHPYTARSQLSYSTSPR